MARSSWTLQLICLLVEVHQNTAVDKQTGNVLVINTVVSCISFRYSVEEWRAVRLRDESLILELVRGFLLDKPNVHL
jgi:hypothetical protein